MRMKPFLRQVGGFSSVAELLRAAEAGGGGICCLESKPLADDLASPNSRVCAPADAIQAAAAAAGERLRRRAGPEHKEDANPERVGCPVDLRIRTRGN